MRQREIPLGFTLLRFVIRREVAGLSWGKTKGKLKGRVGAVAIRDPRSASTCDMTRIGSSSRVWCLVMAKTQRSRPRGWFPAREQVCTALGGIDSRTKPPFKNFSDFLSYRGKGRKST
jgi:hypothetical protein